jgi:hypothetical protein
LARSAAAAPAMQRQPLMAENTVLDGGTLSFERRGCNYNTAAAGT